MSVLHLACCVVLFPIVLYLFFPPSPSALEGQERFGNMTRVYYREAVGAFIVFDVTRPSTFEAVSKWKEDLDSKLILSNGQSVATVLLANKCDQNRDFLTNNGLKMDQYCKENGFVGWFETSAKVKYNICCDFRWSNSNGRECLCSHLLRIYRTMV